MSRLAILPRVMVAPNGARRGKDDHPALPVTIAETVATAAACHAAGAGAIHAHLRDAQGQHWLDSGAYGELIAEMARAVPDMPVQITTEAAGRYDAPAQRALLHRVLQQDRRPEGVSIGLAEMLADGDRAAARALYHDLSGAAVAVQHILYDAGQVTALAQEIAQGTIPGGGLTLLYVLGRYSAGQQSDPAMITPFLTAAADADLAADWAVCAFGRAETSCLAAALAAGGKARVGFENNLHMADGSIAPDNAARVREIAALP
ncbi:3-keto-5-aminohexanoate cleavage protein [Szabonella alba]|uniref:3-keto-5-aminohexanoate cleavage protein n=1 Tax=Szabonella alba TaxID=2804194 RepID=A0A8K0VD01_9RHOB|nr:3-keto-5-aminohexanoate cleavage protein [Szabonella alba]MBL4918801.1 3-keto-5-aminohexanoate cleavage protein [Szabonella alba]